MDYVNINIYYVCLVSEILGSFFLVWDILTAKNHKACCFPTGAGLKVAFAQIQNAQIDTVLVICDSP